MLFQRFLAGGEGALWVATGFKSADPGYPRTAGTGRSAEFMHSGTEPGQTGFLSSAGAQRCLISKRIVLVVAFEAGCQPVREQRTISVVLLPKEVAENSPCLRARALPIDKRIQQRARLLARCSGQAQVIGILADVSGRRVAPFLRRIDAWKDSPLHHISKNLPHEREITHRCTGR